MIAIAHYPGEVDYLKPCLRSCMQHMPLEQTAVIGTRVDGTYETGAWWKAYRTYADEQYFYFLHDSTVMTRPMPFFGPVTVVGWMEGWEGCSPEHIDWIRQAVRPIVGDVDDDFTAVHGSMFFCEADVLAALEEEGWASILPRTKFESQCMERVWGIAFQSLGIEPVCLGRGEDCYREDAIVRKFAGGRQ